MPAEPRCLYHEHLENGQQRVFAVDEVVVSTTTRLGQRVEIVGLRGYGRTLFIDGVRQSSAADEFVYHEMLVHPALFAVEPRTVLIGGGGEGATAREVLRHRAVERAVMVDLDPELVGLCRTHLPAFGAGALDDPRLTLIHDDLRGYLERTDLRFDAIVLDVPEWDGSPELARLYDPAFYATCAARLAPGGVVIGQIGPVHPTRAEAFVPFARARKAAFPHVSFTVVPELGWVFGLASPWPLRAPDEDRWAERLTTPTRYYTPAVHRQLTLLPPYLADAVSGP
ncbi:MAG: hypothetical protein ABMB14_01005 [Myxococcota bacterium]